MDVIWSRDSLNLVLKVKVKKDAIGTAEDFSKANVWVMLIGCNNRYVVPVKSVSNGVTTCEVKVKQAGIDDDVYGVKVVWVKNGSGSPAGEAAGTGAGMSEREKWMRGMRDERCFYLYGHDHEGKVPDNGWKRGGIGVVEIQRAFSLTSYQNDANKKTDVVTLEWEKVAATYGYDGLDAYERAVMLGVTSLSEKQWVYNAEQVSQKMASFEAAETARGIAEELRVQAEEAREAAEAERADKVDEVLAAAEAATSAASAATTLANTTIRTANTAANTARDAAQSAAASAASADAAAASANNAAGVAQGAANTATSAAQSAAAQTSAANTAAAYATQQGNYAKSKGDEAGEKIEAVNSKINDLDSKAEQYSSDHATAVSDHNKAESDHSTAVSDHTKVAGAENVDASVSSDGKKIIITGRNGVSKQVTIPEGGGSGVTSYNDLTDKPTIPTKTSQLTNDSGFATIGVDIAALKDDINGKVDKVAGKGLSTNDYTTADKNKVAQVEDLVLKVGDIDARGGREYVSFVNSTAKTFVISFTLERGAKMRYQHKANGKNGRVTIYEGDTELTYFATSSSEYVYENPYDRDIELSLYESGGGTSNMVSAIISWGVYALAEDKLDKSEYNSFVEKVVGGDYYDKRADWASSSMQKTILETTLKRGDVITYSHKSHSGNAILLVFANGSFLKQYKLTDTFNVEYSMGESDMDMSVKIVIQGTDTNIGGILYYRIAYGIYGALKNQVDKCVNLDSKCGTLSELTTTDKTSLVKAINEVNAKPSGGGSVSIEFNNDGSADITSGTTTEKFLKQSMVAKYGVVKQNQVWTQATDGAYDYEMQNVQRGWIPIDFINRWNDALNFYAPLVNKNIVQEYNSAGRYNEETGYFEYRDLKDISYEEAIAILSWGDGTLQYSYMGSTNIGKYVKIRAKIFGKYNISAWVSTSNVCFGIANTSVECVRGVYHIQSYTRCIYIYNNAYDVFSGVKYLKYLGEFDVTAKQNMDFSASYCLEEVKLVGLNYNMNMKNSPRVTAESVAFLVSRAGTKTLSITLHPTAYARAIADADVQSALASKTNVTLVSA